MSIPVRWLIDLASQWKRAARRRAFLYAMRKRRAVADKIDFELHYHLVRSRGRWLVSCIGTDFIVWTRSPRCYHAMIYGRFPLPETALSQAAWLQSLDAQGANS